MQRGRESHVTRSMMTEFRRQNPNPIPMAHQKDKTYLLYSTYIMFHYLGTLTPQTHTQTHTTQHTHTSPHTHPPTHAHTSTTRAHRAHVHTPHTHTHFLSACVILCVSVCMVTCTCVDVGMYLYKNSCLSVFLLEL